MKYAGKLLLVLMLVLSLVTVLGCEAIDDITGAIDGATDKLPTADPKPVDEAEPPVVTGETVTVAPTQNPEPKDPEPQNDGMKTILVYPQPGITNPTVNGIPIIVGQDNKVQIDPNQPLQMKFNHINSQGHQSEATQDLDTYYDFHVLKANGGWASTIHQPAYETDKTS